MDRPPPWMVRVLRRLALVLTGLGCLVAGTLLVWLVIRPEVLWSVETSQLAVVAGLFVLPGATMLAMRLDTRARLREGAEAERPRGVSGRSG